MPSCLLWILAFLLAGIFPGRGAEKRGRVDFNREIRPIISSKCFTCHGPDETARKAKLRLDLREEAIRERDGKAAIVPGKPEKSEVYRRITTRDSDDIMPPEKHKNPLTPVEIDLLQRWIRQGAAYAPHWALVKPVRPVLPRVRNGRWVKNGIDAFILQKLEAAGLGPSPVADRHALIRRLSLDLTGLPPSPAEVKAFVEDGSPDAYEHWVDRLLASPAYGERWGKMWLDLARYADSAGYGSDPLRLNIWPYRDWVIEAFNRNMRYDRFTIEQIAGDLLPGAGEEERVATAFHRNTMTNTEGGTDDEEFRVAAVKDRANTTAQVWMGLTMGCAQCHTHKYDPITQAEYYQFYAFFNQTEDFDQPDERPTMPLATREQKEQKEQMAALQASIVSAERRMMERSPAFLAEMAAWEKRARTPVAWSVMTPREATGVKGTRLEIGADGVISSEAPAGEVETYVVRVPVKGIVTGLRLEVLPGKSGVGHGTGNAVLTDLRVVASPGLVSRGRYLRVSLPGTEKSLSLAEVQVMSGGKNVATTGKASQSSLAHGGVPARAIDGDTSGDYLAGSASHTDAERDPWWEVDLGAVQAVDEVVIWNRTDGSAGSRLTQFRVQLLDGNRSVAWESAVTEAPKPSVVLAVSGGKPVAIASATADFSQEGFGVENLVDGDPKSGWAFSPKIQEGHAAVLRLAAPLDAGEETMLGITIAQVYGTKATAARLRFAATGQAGDLRELPSVIPAILSKKGDDRTAVEQEQLETYFRSFSTTVASIRREVELLKGRLAAISPTPLPVLKELAPDKLRVTRVMAKGNYLMPGESVSPGLPKALHPMPAGEPANRLGLARWLVSRENPLTARVAVNRFWAQIFGVGLVQTEEDFGSQGSLPSHPELLDWLAMEFMDNGWDMKGLLKSIVMSATYRQSSQVTPRLLEKDPRNVLLSRSPRRRLDAETVRDQAMALSGLLSRKIGGPSVYPPQPEGLWRAAFNGQRTWTTSLGEDKYRRGLYVFWRRTVPYPSMATFDAPSREICTLRRLPTNTPLQAFVTMNDPVYVEAAQALAGRLAREGGASVEAKARYGLELCLGRPASEEQVRALRGLFEKEVAHYREKKPEAQKLSGLAPGAAVAGGVSEAELAAWTVVANVLLNLDGVLTKG